MQQMGGSISEFCSCLPNVREWEIMDLNIFSGLDYVILRHPLYFTNRESIQEKVFSSLRLETSAYENVVGGRLKLKGKALDVKANGIKKKRKHKKHHEHLSEVNGDGAKDGNDEYKNDTANDIGDYQKTYDDHLTPAERRYLQQWEKIDLQRLAKAASKSHRDRIQEFNQYLANLTEHYDIPKVGPG